MLRIKSTTPNPHACQKHTPRMSLKRGVMTKYPGEKGNRDRNYAMVTMEYKLIIWQPNPHLQKPYNPFAFVFVLFVLLHCSCVQELITANCRRQNGEFHSNPVCTDPFRNFPTLGVGVVSKHFQRAPNPPEFAQPRLSSAKWHTLNTPKFVASHLGNTSHIGTNTPKFVPSRWG